MTHQQHRLPGRDIRTNAVGVLCLAVMCLAAGPLAAAQEPARESAQSRTDATGPRPGGAALATGRQAKGVRDLARAEAYFQDALAAADRDGDVYQAALEELTYHLPLMRVERYVLSGHWHRAEQSLQDLLERHQSDEEKSQHLVGLVANLRDHAPVEGGVYAEPGGGRKTVRHIEQTLDRFFEKKGRYPRGYEELNEILPAGRYPLNDYDIVHYAGWGRSYGLTIRNKTNPDNLLSVQRTGLME